MSKPSATRARNIFKKRDAEVALVKEGLGTQVVGVRVRASDAALMLAVLGRPFPNEVENRTWWV